MTKNVATPASPAPRTPATSPSTSGAVHFYRATLGTSNFSFEAYGATERSANAAFRAGLLAHCQQYGLPLSFVTECMEDVCTFPVELGMCLRDRETVLSRTASTPWPPG